MLHPVARPLVLAQVTVVLPVVLAAELVTTFARGRTLLLQSSPSRVFQVVPPSGETWKVHWLLFVAAMAMDVPVAALVAAALMVNWLAESMLTMLAPAAMPVPCNSIPTPSEAVVEPVTTALPEVTTPDTLTGAVGAARSRVCT